MNTPIHPTAEQRADVHDRARRRAQQLRNAAIANFWHGVYRFAVHALRAATRTSTGATRTCITAVSRHPSKV